MVEIDPESEVVFPGITDMASELRVRVGVTDMYMYTMYVVCGMLHVTCIILTLSPGPFPAFLCTSKK